MVYRITPSPLDNYEAGTLDASEISLLIHPKSGINLSIAYLLIPSSRYNARKSINALEEEIHVRNSNP
jgi:hypothetical protein